MGIRFAEGLQVVNLKTPAVVADGNSAHVKVENMQWLSFLIQTGTITDSTDTINFKIYSTTNVAGSTNANDTALPFWYRVSTLATDNWGDITYVSTGSDGVTVTGSDDQLLILDLDPSVIPSKDDGATHVYVDYDATITATDTGAITSIIGVFEPRYPQVEQKSSTSAAT